MPYRRRFAGRRFHRRRGYSRVRRRRFNPYTGRRRLRGARRNRLPPEVHKHTVSVDDATIDVAGVVVDLTDIAGGTAAFSDMVGRRAIIKSINWRCVLSSNAVVATAPLIRVILFVDTNKDVSAPTVAGADDGVLTAATTTSSMNVNTAGRFKIISDRVFNMNPSFQTGLVGGTGGDPAVTKRFYHVFRKLNYRLVLASDSATPLMNKLYCLYISDVDEVGSINAVARIGFSTD